MASNADPPCRCQTIVPVERFWPYVDLPEQPSAEELAALSPELSEALFGTQPLPFSITIEFPPFEASDYARAIEMARASAGYREVGDGDGAAIARGFFPRDARAPALAVRAGGPLRRHRGADRRSPGAIRTRAVAAARVVPDTC